MQDDRRTPDCNPAKTLPLGVLKQLLFESVLQVDGPAATFMLLHAVVLGHDVADAEFCCILVPSTPTGGGENTNS